MQHEQRAADVEDHALAGKVEKIVVAVADRVARALEDEKGRQNAGEEQHVPAEDSLIDEELHESGAIVAINTVIRLPTAETQSRPV